MARFLKPLCALVASSDPGLASVVAWSMPMDLVSGFVLVGWPDLGRRVDAPGRLGHVEAHIDVAGPEVWDRVLEKARGRPVVAIGADEDACRFLSQYRHPRIAVVPTAPVETIRRLDDKWAFEGLCRQLGLPTPKTEFLASKAAIDPDGLVARLGPRIVIKATNTKAGIGMVFANGADELRARVTENPAYVFAPLVAQSFVEGADISRSILARDGVILHGAAQSPGADGLRFLAHDGLAHAVRLIVEATGYSGYGNIDGRLTPDGEVVLLEFNPRPWGTLGKATWCGLNFIRAGLALAGNQASGEPAEVSAGLATLLGNYDFSALRRPWRLLGLTPDQRRLLLEDVLAWAGSRWREMRQRAGRPYVS